MFCRFDVLFMLTMSGDHRVAVFDAFMQLALSDFTITQCGDGSFLCQPTQGGSVGAAMPFSSNPQCVVEAGEVAAHVRALTGEGESADEEEKQHDEDEDENEESEGHKNSEESSDDDQSEDGYMMRGGGTFVIGQTVNKRCRITQVLLGLPPPLEHEKET